MFKIENRLAAYARNFDNRNIYLADIEGFRLGVFDQIKNHRHFIAAVEFRTIDAIHPDLARQGIVRHDAKAQFGEKNQSHR